MRKIHRFMATIFHRSASLLLAALCILTVFSTAALGEFQVVDSPFDSDATSLSLTAEQMPPIEELIAALQKMENLQDVRLTECKLSRDDMRLLLKALPHLRFEWEVVTNGKKINSLLEYFDFGKTRIRAVDNFIDALSCLPNLKAIDTYTSEFSRAQMDTMAETYPDIEFGWTLVVAKRRVRTDATAFSTNSRSSDPRYKSDHFEVLKYCKNLKALDLGHNYIQDLSFLRHFPDLELLILSDNHISDISILTDMDALTYIELFKNEITDVSPLANKPALVDLNLCLNYTLGEIDLSPLLTNSKLERLWISRCRLSDEQQQTLISGLPDCHVSVTAGHSTAEGWRDHERYSKYRAAFLSSTWTPFDGTEKPLPPAK